MMSGTQAMIALAVVNLTLAVAALTLSALGAAEAVQPTAAPSPSQAFRNVFMYWQGPSYVLVDLLRDLAAKHAGPMNYTLHVVNEDNVQEYLGHPMPPEVAGWEPAHRADYVRVCLLYKYGGIWLDADTIVMPTFGDLFSHLDTKQGFFVLERDDRPCNGVFGTRPGTRLLREWKALIETRFRAPDKLEWNEIGSEFLATQLKHIRAEYVLLRGADTVYPLHWQQYVHEFLLQPYEHYRTLVRPVQPLVVLVNSVYKGVEGMGLTKADLLAQTTMPLNYFLRVSSGLQ
jgi:hypothetical protein